VTLTVAGLIGGCAAEPAPITTRLVNVFAPELVAGSVAVDVPEPTTWRFDGEGTVAFDEGDAATFGWTALHGVDGFEVADGVMRGTTGEHAFVAVERPANMDPADLVHGIEVRMRAPGGGQLGIWFIGDEEVDADAIVAELDQGGLPSFRVPLRDSDEVETYLLTSADATFLPSFSLGMARHILVLPSDAAGVDFEIEQVRLITRREELASIESGIGWQGLSEVYREAIVARSPERITFDVPVPADAMLDLAVGTIDSAPVTFVVEVGGEELLRRTVTTPQRWEAVPLDLAGHAGAATNITLSLQAAEQGAIGFWGTPIIRRRVKPQIVASEARRILTEAGAPRGVILIVADTLRKDHLAPWGYERDNAPTLARMAAEGTRFADNISQGTWTKVAVPSILTSLYASSHGIVDLPDRMPTAATTIEEAFQEAGYATFHTSSVPFSGKLTNLHQGVEVLHEAASVGDLGHSTSKTARTYVDRFLGWLDQHSEVPFFAFVHVFDPHSPYRPYPPYDTMYTSADANAAFETQMETIGEAMESQFMRGQGTPFTEDIEAVGVDVQPFVDHQQAWYDASIRAMDAEIARLLERLEALGIGDDTLIGFVADHGEEFQEHGRSWHGLNVYGYMINTPMMLWWPGVVPAGLVIDETTQSIDLTPTLAALAGIEAPDIWQGQSMVPLLANPDNPESIGWEWRPAFSERLRAPSEVLEGANIDSYTVIAGGWKLIHNVANRPDGWPEYELYDHAEDPLNLTNVADTNPEVVQQLSARLDELRSMADAARLSDEGLAEGMDPAELERLRALGYIR